MSGPGASAVGVGQRLTILLCAALIAVQVVRSAAVAALAEAQPQSAAKFWPGHPEVESQLGMVAIAAATGKGRPVPQSALDALRGSAREAPLAAEPYLVGGVQAQLAGNGQIARAAFIAAERRDPRSLAAHYFLAEQDLRSGNVAHGLSEIAVLARLAPNGAAGVAPYLAKFARDRRNWPQLRALFGRDPHIAGYALASLAADPTNADTILALSDRRAGGAENRWLAPLLASMIAAGDYAKAQALWAASAKVRLTPGEVLFDPAFRDPTPLAPFNWMLTSSPVGLAERRPGGRLHAIYYGQQDGALARQLLVLKPGTYRVAMRVSGDPARVAALYWSVTCANAQAPIAKVSLAIAARQAWTFAVPATCPAQWFDLAGVAGDMAQQVDLTISDLRMSRVGNGG